MGSGVSSGGGQSYLGYLFGSGESPKPAASSATAAPTEVPGKDAHSAKRATGSQPVGVTKQIPAGVNSSNTNNYFHADGQNCGNFITVHRAHN